MEYQFKVEVRNKYGYSVFSNTVSILSSQIPSRPAKPTTTWNIATDEVTITWVAPDDGGSAIISYTVYIQESDGNTYTTELQYCDGSQLVS